MAKKQTFTPPAAPGANYTPIQNQEPAPEQPAKTEYYRFNAKMPIECKDYLQEMAWRATVKEHRNVTITEYLTRIVRADMEAHPEWKETLDILNT